MEIGHDETREIVRIIWESVLGWEIHPVSAPEQPHDRPDFHTAIIQIAGAWEGAVVCMCSETLLRRAAQVMFRLDADTITTDLLHDALGELTNMVGGNLKALLPGPSYLCLPAVVDGTDYAACVPEARPVLEASFLCQQQQFVVKILAVRGAESLQETCA